MRQIIIVLALLASMAVHAQDFTMLRRGCTPDIDNGETTTARAQVPRRLAPLFNTWDPNQVYRQLVILVTFKGDSTYFNMENPREEYDRLFNEKCYNNGAGKGCVADYFRDQSYGQCNLQFDIYGPYETSGKAQPYANPTSDTYNTGRSAMMEATQMMLNENPGMSFNVYDWNGNGWVNQVLYVFAGYSGNNAKSFGYVWPNTNTISTIQTPSGQRISNYSVTAECWPIPDKESCGIGTICHEFSHSLGLPDIYPTNSSAGYSMVDEWDVMDGGNFTNYGWCPPNYSPLEKILMKWLEPIELTEATTITGLKSVADGGEIYKIRHTDDEYYLLENRQWTGWDAGVPGRGLVVYHVKYSYSRWSSNMVNSIAGSPFYSIVHADGLDYDAWEALVAARGYTSQYQDSSRMKNYHLSTSPYPWSTDSTTIVNNELSDTSSPASLMYETNAEGRTYLSKAIRNISMTDDGLISFDFEGYIPNPVRTVTVREQPTRVYDLHGRYVGRRIESQRPGLYLVIQPGGSTKKVVKR